MIILKFPRETNSLKQTLSHAEIPGLLGEERHRQNDPVAAAGGGGYAVLTDFKGGVARVSACMHLYSKHWILLVFHLKQLGFIGKIVSYSSLVHMYV